MKFVYLQALIGTVWQDLAGLGQWPSREICPCRQVARLRTT